jgi:ABC-type glutathione transport system ATPase component
MLGGWEVSTQPVLSIKNLRKTFRTKIKGQVSETIAVNSVSFGINEGEVFGLVGESGSGKTTIANLVMKLDEADSGSISFNGKAIVGEQASEYPFGDIQIVFQDPRSSLDPRMTVRQIISEPAQRRASGHRERLTTEERLVELVQSVGLRAEHLNRRPHQFSGGQRQRIAIARALITEPRLLVLDEPTSALDVSVQAQVINLLKKLQRDRGLTYLFISHNMGVVKYLCDRIGVLSKGTLVEVGTNEAIFNTPSHEYTQRLLASVPTMNSHG